MDEIEVLVCDDSALMRNLISRIIDGTEGMKVCGTAMNGKFALQKLDTLKPDMILLDIEMPEMNGVQFLEERKKLGIKIPVVILSSIATEGASVTMKCLELGASDFITKPSGSTSSSISSVGSSIIKRQHLTAEDTHAFTENRFRLPNTTCSRLNSRKLRHRL